MLLGIIFGALYIGNLNDIEPCYGVAYVLLWYLLLLICIYILFLIASITSKCIFLGWLAFFLFGYKIGEAFAIIFSISVFRAIISALLIYIPTMLFTFLMMCIIFRIIIGYSCHSSSYSSCNSCGNIRNTIYRSLLIIFLINLAVLVIYVLIFGNLINVISPRYIS